MEKILIQIIGMTISSILIISIVIQQISIWIYQRKVASVDIELLKKKYKNHIDHVEGTEKRIWSVNTKDMKKHESEALIREMIKRYHNELPRKGKENE